MSEAELIDVVDEQDNIIDVKPKKEVREKVLIHRGVVILALNSNDEVFVHQRALTKKTTAGYWDIFFGGYVSHNEDYLNAALRELEEESGIKATDLTFITKFRFRVSDDDWFGKLYKCVFNGNLKLQKEEIDKGFFIPINELDNFIQKNKIKPASLFVYDNYKDLILREFNITTLR